ncbi:carbohydrate esterase family 8 protein [Serpula lacrymans var. lacrymans S7.3]|uniref:pectinesterase n=2 Tax=Serpula lacrymans var. lacrymans TaxID=341189 RepID=F8Q1H6_SERL3|nr:carbohydrate esterase family 8 protein [Serpula lacrymans var. lacrymans S7.9]EGN98154.1 carbohydrate esterase family 8 protein [Serpula lacrymans var. lacrymans S7.3]EGO23728.1 carbohydrate esterase family 8 protein [Serpula lacrymans var. lacrymans S7.9]
MLKDLAFIFAFFVAQVYSLSPAFIACQLQKADTVSPLAGCPEGTIFVSPNDPRAQYTTVQQAVESLPETGGATILIGEGQYFEAVNVTRTGPLTLLGQLDASTAFDPAGNASSRNLVQIWNNKYVLTGMDDAQSAVLTVAPSFNASLIGAGTNGAPLQPLFGNTDFKAYNIDFENQAANYSISQALVTDISYANASFYGCAFASYQDTWYTGRNASTYVVDSIIYGQTDYLFGFGTAWFQSITLANRACGGGIVAWKGSNYTAAPGNRYGAYISDSKIIRSPDANATAVTENSCWLGRPWNDLATTVYLRTYMDDSVQPAGFEPFDSARPVIANTTYYAEYDSYGPGANMSARVSIEHVLDTSEARNFTIDGVFLERPQWIDYDYVY